MKALKSRLAEPVLDNPLENLIGYQLRRTSVMLGADLTKRLEPLGLTVITLSVLLLIEANPGLTQSQIGRRLSIKSANMAPLTAQLVDRGLIERLPADGRSHGLRLAPDGVRLTTTAWTGVKRNEGRFLARLTAQDQAELKRLLVLMRGAEDAPPAG